MADVALGLAVVSATAPVTWCEITDSGGREQGCYPSLAFGVLGAAALLLVAGIAGAVSLDDGKPRSKTAWPP